MAGLPSPTPSPPNLDAPDAPQTKKRQRSASMHSAEVPVSPPRRAPSQGLDRDSPPHEFVQAHLDEASRRIEGLFARGPLDDVPNDVLSYPPSPGPDDLQRGPMWQDVPATQKSLTAQTLMKGQMQAGDTWYLVSARWMKRWRKAVDGTEDKEGPVKEHDLGPIDNSDLLDESGNLVAPLVEGENVEYVSKTLWDMFVAWYVCALRRAFLHC
jgi:ubiquitin carboxyl-terminal hydrolase 4/11/15